MCRATEHGGNLEVAQIVKELVEAARLNPQERLQTAG